MDFNKGTGGYAMTQVQTSTAAAAPETMNCTSCGAPCEKRVSNSAKNPGREYWRCTGCNNFVGWTDGKNNFGGGGAKRARGGGGGGGGGLGASVDALRERVTALEQRLAAIEGAQK